MERPAYHIIFWTRIIIMENKKFDVVIFGATSFVGQIMTKHIAETIDNYPNLSWAIAGRSKDKLQTLKNELGENFSKLNIFVCDAFDTQKLNKLCESTKVIATTVGPYALYGEALIKACANIGTHYCDLSGEAYWIKDMIVKYGKAAKQSGSKIVNCCGFDSIPSDLGVFELQKYSKEQFGSYAHQIKLGVEKTKGGASGGTLASMIQAVIAAKQNPQLRKEMGNPYNLCPEFSENKLRQNRITSAKFDNDYETWSAPFIMEAINTRVVLRSHLLSNKLYGEDFLYQEQMLMGKGISGYLKSISLVLGIGLFALLVFLTPTRKLLQRFVLPKPGEGPSVEEQKNGFFKISLLGKIKEGKTVTLKVSGDTDPGYGCTAKMLTQSALCLAFDLNHNQKGGGFYTPATAMGGALTERLQQYAGMKFEI